MPAFLRCLPPSENSYLSFVNRCALCYLLQMEAECHIYASLTPVHENLPIPTKLLSLVTYFVRSKAVAALKAVHASQAASHSVGSLREKRQVISSVPLPLFPKVKQRWQQLCRWTQHSSGTWHIWRKTTDHGASSGYYKQGLPPCSQEF